MSTLVLVLVIVAGALLFTAALFAAIVLIGRAVYSSGVKKLEALGFESKRTADARSFGLTSLGPAQVRGNGVLALDESELLFLQAIPHREIRIPLAAITKVDTPRSHLGKTMGGKLLHVTWAADGTEDSIAWQLNDLEGWIASLEAARAARTQS